MIIVCQPVVLARREPSGRSTVVELKLLRVESFRSANVSSERRVVVSTEAMFDKFVPITMGSPPSVVALVKVPPGSAVLFMITVMLEMATGSVGSEALDRNVVFGEMDNGSGRVVGAGGESEEVVLSDVVSGVIAEELVSVLDRSLRSAASESKVFVLSMVDGPPAASEVVAGSGDEIVLNWTWRAESA